ncbi:MAG TPA: 3' terminal RNA ribose 2'-O-methyltransferase Hen1 [Streptosporangiaceae bacterium]|jgi:3' terminal RNA ribose 2'-O-methyltransferase Hen1
MLLTITSTSPPATDLGFLLHKNPAAVRTVEAGFGTAHVFYPEAGPQRCTAALLCEVDPVALVRRSRGGVFPLAAYVNDRPYAASSFLSVALKKVFGTALRGQCKDRPELVDERLDLAARLPVLPCRGGERLLRRLFEPLGYAVTARPVPLAVNLPGRGGSPYFDVTVSARCRVRDLLGHLYVLLPVTDGDKHYWVSQDEIGKLVDGAGEWLAGHPERDLIVRRYLRYQQPLVNAALARLAGDEPGTARLAAAEGDGPADAVPARASLREARAAAVLAVLRESGARRVLDLGCGDGRLLALLRAEPQFDHIVGVDASAAALSRAARRLGVAEMAPRQRERIQLLQGALTYRDRRLAGYDAAVLMEVIEHVDPGRLDALEQAVLGGAAPGMVVITTPNAEYNVRYPGLADGGFRHPDHRFEWTRREFRGWATAAARRHGYTVSFRPAGPEDPVLGAPTQLAVLQRPDGSAAAAKAAAP